MGTVIKFPAMKTYRMEYLHLEDIFIIHTKTTVLAESEDDAIRREQKYQGVQIYPLLIERCK